MGRPRSVAVDAFYEGAAVAMLNELERQSREEEKALAQLQARRRVSVMRDLLTHRFGEEPTAWLTQYLGKKSAQFDRFRVRQG